MGWQVGSLQYSCLDENDPVFDNLDDATSHACRESLRGKGDNIIGVWTGQDEGSILQLIAFEGELFVLTQFAMRYLGVNIQHACSCHSTS